MKEIPWINQMVVKYGDGALNKFVKKLKYSIFTSAQILEQGDFVDRLFIIVKGKVKVSKISHFGDSHEHSKQLGLGEVFGESSFESENKSTTSVYAIKEVHLLSILKIDFSAIICKEFAYK